MQKLKAHIGFKISLLVLIAALLVPSFVKLAHAFESHQHEVCKTPQKSHFHELDLDCEFYKFKLSNAFHCQFKDYYLASTSLTTTVNNLYTSSYSNFQVQQISLRGPPQLI